MTFPIPASSIEFSDVCLKDLVAAVQGDPVLRPLLIALDRYGRAGRFYNLDLLADSPQTNPSLAKRWDQAGQAALHDLEIMERQRVAMERLSDNGAWEAFHAGVRKYLADSIE